MLLYKKPRAFRKNYIIIGEPIQIQGENPKRLTKEEVEQNLENYNKKMEELRAELNEYVDSKKHHKKKEEKAEKFPARHSSENVRQDDKTDRKRTIKTFRP